MMGEIHSGESGAKLFFDERGDYILKHSFAVQTAVASSNPVWISVEKKKSSFPLMCESPEQRLSAVLALACGKKKLHLNQTLL